MDLDVFKNGGNVLKNVSFGHSHNKINDFPVTSELQDERLTRFEGEVLGELVAMTSGYFARL